VLHEGYMHCFVDDEFIATAKFRHAFVHAPQSVIEHLHPDWGKGVLDSTYEKSKASMVQGRVVFRERKHLWGGK
jgi:hypothetical protein